jgi:hypothetical protein
MTNRDDGGRHNPWRPADSEPEILPPEKSGQSRRAHRIWISVDEADGARRIYWPGPFTLVLALAILGLIGVVMLIVLLSVAVIWIPVVIVLIVAFVLSVTFRRWWEQLRRWMARR